MTRVQRFGVLLPVLFLLNGGCQTPIAQPSRSTLVVISPVVSVTPVLTPSAPVVLVPPIHQWELGTVRGALIRDSLIFVSAPPMYVAAFDLNLGTLAWQRDDLPLSLPMAADNEHLYIVSEGSVVALRGTTGEIKWRTSVPTEDPHHELVALEEAQAVLYGNIPWGAEGRSSHLWALDAHDGDVLWRSDLSAPLDPYRPVNSWQRHSAIAYDSGQVYLRLARLPPCCFTILALNAELDFGLTSGIERERLRNSKSEALLECECQRPLPIPEADF